MQVVRDIYEYVRKFSVAALDDMRRVLLVRLNELVKDFRVLVAIDEAQAARDELTSHFVSSTAQLSDPTKLVTPQRRHVKREYQRGLLGPLCCAIRDLDQGSRTVLSGVDEALQHSDSIGTGTQHGKAHIKPLRLDQFSPWTVDVCKAFLARLFHLPAELTDADLSLVAGRPRFLEVVIRLLYDPSAYGHAEQRASSAAAARRESSYAWFKWALQTAHEHIWEEIIQPVLPSPEDEGQCNSVRNSLIGLLVAHVYALTIYALLFRSSGHTLPGAVVLSFRASHGCQADSCRLCASSPLLPRSSRRSGLKRI